MTTTKIEQQVRNLITELDAQLFEDEGMITIAYQDHDDCELHICIRLWAWHSEVPIRGKELTDQWRAALEELQSAKAMR